jgi:hypothetical protein
MVDIASETSTKCFAVTELPVITPKLFAILALYPPSHAALIFNRYHINSRVPRAGMDQRQIGVFSFGQRSSAMAERQFGVERLEGRRLLSAGGPSSPTPPVPVIRQDFVNGGFEASPDFTGWQTTGNDLIEAGDFYKAPEGNLQAVITNGLQPSNGGTPVSAANLESFLGLKTGALSSPKSTAVNGSAISQNVTGRAGDFITFKADFLTNEAANAHKDYGFITVTFNNKSVLLKLSSLAYKTIASPNNTGFMNETGYHTYAILLPFSGTYTIGFGVVNVGDSLGSSALLVDNAQLQTRPFIFDFRGDGDANANGGSDHDRAHNGFDY